MKKGLSQVTITILFLIITIVSVTFIYTWFMNIEKQTLYCNLVGIGDPIFSEDFVVGDIITINENLTIKDRSFFGYICLQVFSFAENTAEVDFNKVSISKGNLSYNIPINRSEKINIQIDFAPMDVQKGEIYCFLSEDLEPIWFQEDSIWDVKINMSIIQNGTAIFRNVLLERVR